MSDIRSLVVEHSLECGSQLRGTLLARGFSREEAEQVLQEAYVRIIAKVDGGYKVNNLKSAMSGFVSNVGREFHRMRKKLRTSYEDVEIDMVSREYQSLIEVDEMDALRRCMELLSGEERRLIELREIENLSFRKLQAVTNIPASTIENHRLPEIIGRLRDCISNSI